MSDISSDRQAVSPVIGVILLVAVTVVLSAAVFAVVAEMTDTQQSPNQNAGVSVDHGATDTGSTVTLTVVTGSDLAYKVGDGDPQPLGSTGKTVTLVEGEDYEAGDRITVLNDDTVVQTVATRATSSGDGTTLTTVGEIGRTTVNAESRTDWQTLNFENTYDNPVLIIQPPSHNGGNSGHIRVNGVGADSAEIVFEETSDEDGPHTTETVHYIVMEEGEHVLADGNRVEAGTVDTDHTFTTVAYTTEFDTTPAVFTHPHTYNGGDPIKARTRGVTTTDFETAVQEDTYDDGSHTVETVGYIAAETLIAPDNEVQIHDKQADDYWQTFGFVEEYNTDPAFIAGITTYNGPDAASLRYDNLQSTQVDLLLEDPDGSHNAEDFAYWVFDEPRDIQAQE